MIAYLDSSVLLRLILRQPGVLKEWKAVDLTQIVEGAPRPPYRRHDAASARASSAERASGGDIFLGSRDLFTQIKAVDQILYVDLLGKFPHQFQDFLFGDCRPFILPFDGP